MIVNKIMWSCVICLKLLRNNKGKSEKPRKFSNKKYMEYEVRKRKAYIVVLGELTRSGQKLPCVLIIFL